MLRLNRILCTAAVLVTAACSGDSPSPVAPADAPAREILDAARSPLVQGFYWLAPLVPTPTFSGTFDPNVSPTVQVCELAGPPPSTCTSTIVAQFTKTSGTGGQLVTVNTGGQYYQANWHTDLSSLNTAKFYRISVFVGATELGHADVDPVNSGKELKNVDTDELIPLVDGRTLPIKFRIEVGAGPTQRAPAAQADAYGTVENTALTVPDGATDLLANDDLGVPAATLTSFGGGSLGGAVTDHAAGTTATFGSGGSLTVNANGGFTFTPASGFSGSFSFVYRISNVAGTSDATVTITVNAGPTAVDDAPAAGSAPGDPYHAPFNSALSLAAPGILQNDVLGSPAATVASFGGGSLGGTVTDHAAGSSASFGSGGSLSVNADGSLVFTPSAGFTGLFTFEYRIANVVASDVGQVTIAVGTRPAAANDTYGPTLVGNVPVNTATSSGFSVRANDAGDGATLALTSVSNGTAILDLATGTFSFDPAPGYEGPAGFSYSVTNGFGTVTASVSLNVSGMVWFIDNGAAAGSGTLSSPFSSVAAFNAVNDGAGAHPAAGDNVFIHESGTSYTGPLALLDGQRVIGQDATASLASLTGLAFPADSPVPAMNSANATVVNIVSAANGIDLAQNNSLHGLRVGNTTGTGIAGAGFGTLTVSDVTVNTTGQALALSGGTLAADFKGVSSSGGAVNVALTNVGGTGDLGTGALSGSTSAAFQVQGGSGTLAYAGSIAATTGRSVAVSGRSGGSVTLSGAIADSGTGIVVHDNTGGTIAFTGASKTVATGAGAGVTLSNNTGATVQFAGGGLAITTTTGAGFSATGGGTVQVTGANNTIASAGGVALGVVNTTIGASGITFRSISANGGTGGIVLSGTGSANGLNVTGSGAAGSGGTIQNTTGDGISLTDARSVTLASMLVSSNAGSGIRATSVDGLALSSMQVLNNTDAAGEAGLLLTELRGTSSVSATEVSGSTENNVRVRNTTNTPASLAFSGCTVRDNSSAAGNFGISVEGAGSASLTVSVSGCAFSGNRTVALRAEAADNAQLDFTASGNTVTAGAAGKPQGNQGIEILGSGSGSLTYDVAGNSVSGLASTAINVFSGSTSALAGKVRNNTIVNAGAGVSGFGIRVFQSSNSTLRANVSGNSVSNVGLDYGILAEGSGSLAPGAGQARLDVALTGNSASVLSGALDAIRVQARNANTVCARIAGNTTNTGGSGAFGLFARQANTATFNLEGLAAGAQTAAATQTYLSGQNPAAATVGTTATTSFTGVAANSCNVPA
ncbi:MAG: cadherin-like domain-containing protein [Longimicrobiaceae bacterium]